MEDKSRSKIFSFFGLHRNLAVILAVVFFVELGEKVGERFLPIYIVALGGSALVVGLSNALDNLLSALYSLPGGYLSDRVGYKRSLIFFNVVSMAGYLIAILFPSWQAAVLGAILFTSWSSMSLPAIMSAISKVLPEDLGEWIKTGPKGAEFFSEQQLRRYHPEHYPEWVPKSSIPKILMHRPDGYWNVPVDGGFKAVALEIELNHKASSAYKDVARFYDDVNLDLVLWFVAKESSARYVQRWLNQNDAYTNRI